MVFLVFSLILFTTMLSGIGYGFRKFSFVDSLAGYLFHGILVLTFLWGILAFFFPVGVWIELVSLVAGCFLFFKHKLYLRFFKLKLPASFFILLFLILLSGSYAPFILDQFGYYVPSIKWIQTAGWVAGVANIEWVLGQMSFWHLLEAGFSKFGDPFLRFNTFFLVFFLLYVYEKKCFALLLILPFALLFTQGPSPDLPVILLSLVLVAEIMTGNRRGVFLFGVFIFVIKPTMIWTPMLAFVILLSQRNFRLKYLVPGLSLLILFLIKNLVVSGYPFFPTSILSFELPWTPGRAMLQTSNRFALMKSYDMLYSYQELVHAGFLERVKWWLVLPGIKGKINLLLVFSWIVFSIFCYRKKSKLLWLIFGCLFLKTIFVLSFSAQYRFFMDVLIVMGILILWNLKSERTLKVYAAAFSILILCLLGSPKILNQLIPSFRLSAYMSNFKITQLLKPREYVYQKYRTLALGNTVFHVTEDYPFIFDTPTPGITQNNLQQYLKLNYIPQQQSSRSFYAKKITPEERKQIEDFLKGKD